MSKTALEFIEDIADLTLRTRILQCIKEHPHMPDIHVYDLQEAFDMAFIWRHTTEGSKHWEQIRNSEIKLTSEIKAEWERDYEIILGYERSVWLDYQINIEDIINYLNQKHGIEHTITNKTT